MLVAVRLCNEIHCSFMIRLDVESAIRFISTLGQDESNESSSSASLNVTTVDAEGIVIQFHEPRDGNVHKNHGTDVHSG